MFDFDDLDDDQLVDTDSPNASAMQLRIWAVSDVHSDHEENLEWVKRFRNQSSLYCNDCLIVAGDLTHHMDILRETLCLFKEVFKYVFFVPGNHDLWYDGTDFVDSLDKLQRIMALCDEIGVITKPTELPLEPGGKTVLIVPILSWHHQSFDTEPQLSPSWSGFKPAESVISDYSSCFWPSGLSQLDDTVAERLDEENDVLWAGTVLENGSLAVEKREEAYAAVISFSHFLPRIELCLEKRFLTFPNLIKAVGSKYLGLRVGKLRPDVHVFGHTHFGWDMELDGTRFVQAPVGYANERKVRIASVSIGDFVPGYEGTLTPGAARPFLVWSPNSEELKTRGACWSSFYKHYGRRHQVEVLPLHVAMSLQWNESKEPLTGWGGQAPVLAFVDDARIAGFVLEQLRSTAATDKLDKFGGDFKIMSAKDLLDRMQHLKRHGIPPTWIFDVRPADEFKQQHVYKAISVPLQELHRLPLLLPKPRRLGILERMTDHRALKVIYGSDDADGLAGSQLMRKLASEKSTNFVYVHGGFAACKTAGMNMASGMIDGFASASGHLK